MTLKDMAARLGIKSTSQLRRAIGNGTLAAEKWGRDWLVADAEYARYAALKRKPGYPKGRPRRKPEGEP